MTGRQEKHDGEKHHGFRCGVSDAVIAEAVFQHVEHEHPDELAGRALRVRGEHESLPVNIEGGDHGDDRYIERHGPQLRHGNMPETFPCRRTVQPGGFIERHRDIAQADQEDQDRVTERLPGTQDDDADD